MKKSSHLDDNQMIDAVIDENGLDGLLRSHLSECHACRARKEELEARLARFGKLLRSNAPVEFRKPQLAEKSAGVMINGWRSHATLAICAVLAFVVLIGSPIVTNKDKLFTKAIVYREMLQDQKFMAQVQSLEQNPLPGFYVDISSPGSDKPIAATPGPGAQNDAGPAPKGGSQNA